MLKIVFVLLTLAFSGCGKEEISIETENSSEVLASTLKSNSCKTYCEQTKEKIDSCKNYFDLSTFSVEGCCDYHLDLIAYCNYRETDINRINSACIDLTDMSKNLTCTEFYDFLSIEVSDVQLRAIGSCALRNKLAS